jgi:hypothetical protein
MKISRIGKCWAVIGILLIIAGRALADPWPDEALKFYQMPLNNGATPYLVPAPPTYPPTPGYGTVASTAIFPGHDELSTATRTSPDPFAPWTGEYMADDFADYAGTPVTHVRWWGSYLNQTPNTSGVKRFLISFEHNIPAGPDPSNPNAILPSRPNFSHPGNLHQIVTVVPGIAPPPPGTFTEKPIPTGAGPIPPPEPLFEYNAELHLDKWFYEQKAARGENNVYWLKIVALVDVQQDGPIQWGWHNRDWSIPNALAAKPPDTPDGAEHIQGFVPGPLGPRPVWHFEDDAVLGGITVFPNPTMPIMPTVQQFGAVPQNYILPWDLPSNTTQLLSKDLAFELYTRIPEPASVTLFAIGCLAVAGLGRRRG